VSNGFLIEIKNMSNPWIKRKTKAMPGRKQMMMLSLLSHYDFCPLSSSVIIEVHCFGANGASIGEAFSSASLTVVGCAHQSSLLH
jgi:hypothetical protein